MPSALKRILCVDDNEDTCLMLEMFLGQAGYKTVSAQSNNEALKLILTEKFDLFVLDLWMKDSQKLELCRRIREFDSTTPIVIYSADARPMSPSQLSEANVQAYLIKPQGLDDLVETIKKLVETPTQQKAGS